MIDTSRLEKVKRHHGKIIAQCPACAANGRDSKGQHLIIMPNGKFGCAAHQQDREHTREIFRLVGIKQDITPDAAREARLRKIQDEAAAASRKRMILAAQQKRQAIVRTHPWSSADAVRSSSIPPESCNDPRQFIQTAFSTDAVIWTGELHHSGKNHAARWKTASAWMGESLENVGPCISPCTWIPGTTSRSRDYVLHAPYVVLDFDGIDGKKPSNNQELRQHLAESMAITRWLMEEMQWRLFAIIYSGNVSLHAWFHAPSKDAVESLKSIALPLGIDAGLIGHPEHPCRLPGWSHPKSGKLSRVIYIDSNPANP